MVSKSKVSTYVFHLILLLFKARNIIHCFPYYFQFPVTRKEFGPIHHVEFSPVAPHHFALTASAKVRKGCGNEIHRYNLQITSGQAKL